MNLFKSKPALELSESQLAALIWEFKRSYCEVMKISHPELTDKIDTLLYRGNEQTAVPAVPVESPSKAELRAEFNKLQRNARALAYASVDPESEVELDLSATQLSKVGRAFNSAYYHPSTSLHTLLNIAPSKGLLLCTRQVHRVYLQGRKHDVLSWLELFEEVVGEDVSLLIEAVVNHESGTLRAMTIAPFIFFAEPPFGFVDRKETPDFFSR